MNTIFRLAQKEDIPLIAALHAKSWQLHYRGSLNDEFLDGPVIADRLAVWKKRLTDPPEDQWIMTVWQKGQLQGFVCIYLNDDPTYGALLDNLHVEVAAQRRGYGKTLLEKGKDWVKSQRPDGKMYLWVLEKNTGAQKFYRKVGGTRRDTKVFQNPGGGSSIAVRYDWEM